MHRHIGYKLKCARYFSIYKVPHLEIITRETYTSLTHSRCNLVSDWLQVLQNIKHGLSIWLQVYTHKLTPIFVNSIAKQIQKDKSHILHANSSFTSCSAAITFILL
jgi:hypothetical protein